MKYLLIIGLAYFSVLNSYAAKILNVYIWGGEIPRSVVQKFEKETAITVNVSHYDSNETLYAKLKASPYGLYDIILPSAYFVERMKQQEMLTKLDTSLLPQLKNLDLQFTNNDYDQDNQFSIPYIWGVTGIFYNKQQVTFPPKKWQQLWDSRWKNKLMLLDDSREIFSMALLSLGFKPNDSNPQHIKQAYEHLLTLRPNIKLFASDSIQALIIDEDAIAGVSWNGDAFKARLENPSIHFVYPKEGFVIWIDCLAIPKNAPHLKEAYQFINFMLRPDIAFEAALKEGHATTNRAGRDLLPQNLRENPIIYPPR